MCSKVTVKRAVLILSLPLLLALFACGELNTSLLSSGGTYQVKALVNDTPLESCSIIRQDDKIIPYFAVSVVNDPDLTGLLVYLKNTKGDIVGERVLYTIDPEYTALKQQEETKDNEKESKTAEQAEKQASVDTKSAVKKYDVVIPVKSFGKKMPVFPLSNKIDIGQYSLVFESLGKSNTLSLTELDIFFLGNLEFLFNDISMYLPWLSDTRLIPPGATVMLEAGLKFDSRFNPYVIWYNGKNIISEGNISEGAGNILWKAPEQPGFYSLRLEVFPYHLKRKFTGISRDINIPVSAKASQTGYFFENDSEHTVTATIPPKYSEPLRLYRFDGNINEASSIPDRMFESAGKKPPRWAVVDQSYGLSLGPDDTYLLRPINFFRQGQNQGGGIFMFHIRPITEGTIFSAFFPTLASASALSSASDGVWMDMTTREDAITLRLKTKESSVEIPVSQSFSGEQGLIPIVVEFYIRPYRFEAKLILSEDFSKQSKAGGIKLPGALAGEGRIKLGVDKSAPSSAVENINGSVLSNNAVSKNSSETGDGVEENADIETVQPAVTTIWNEFAILYSTTPLLPEDYFVENYNSVKKEESAGVGAPLKNEAATIRIEQAPAEDEDAKPLISTL